MAEKQEDFRGQLEAKNHVDVDVEVEVEVGPVDGGHAKGGRGRPLQHPMVLNGRINVVQEISGYFCVFNYFLLPVICDPH